ncbi:DEAD/DEAH box helicase [bacterium]|nr:DEAD/DEAH box helicase [bacterium]
MQISDPIGQIKGVGKNTEQLLRSVGIVTLADLLSYLPYTYEDSSEILSILEVKVKSKKLPQWELGKNKFAVKAILRKSNSFSPRRGLFLITAIFSDTKNEQTIKSIWFNQPYITTQLVEGSEYVLFGKVQISGSSYTLQSPKFERVVAGKTLEKLGKILPIYRRVKAVTSTYLRKFITESLTQIEISEFLSDDDLRKFHIPNLSSSYHSVHCPDSLEKVHQGSKRLAIQEILELKQDYDRKFLTKKVLDQESSELGKSIARSIGILVPKLPFTLTNGQKQILQSIVEKIESGDELDSLLYGDVGSGKTIIALLIALAFALEKKDSILIAPTTILASQHYKLATEIIKNFGLQDVVNAVEVSARQKKPNTRTDGSSLYVGTQAILHDQELLKNRKVAFVTIDEQHRFGVEQRMSLKQNGRYVLTLSATPIPRTLALSFLRFSQALFLEERPLGRKETISKVVPFDKEEVTYEWIAKKLHFGEQAYIVFPRIESEEDNEKQSLLAMSAFLKEKYFSTISSALLHGGMKEEEKAKVMTDFSSGKTRLLYATSVIEVGVDVANATIIAIHGAELFGLAQLHQLRGRVGRSSQQGYCFLFPNQEANTSIIERLDYFATHTSGNDVSEYDLIYRGAGSLTGTLQAGASDLRIASLNDLSLIKNAVTIYDKLVHSNTSIPRYIRVKSA